MAEKERSLDRRSFIKGAAILGGAAAAVGLAGCSSSEPQAPIEEAPVEEASSDPNGVENFVPSETVDVTLPSWDDNVSEISLEANGMCCDNSGLTLEQQVTRLEDLRAIQNLKFAYWDAVDSKDIDRVANEVFAPDIHFEYPDFGVVADGSMECAKRAAGSLLNNAIRSCHQGHQEYLRITGDTTAHGVWTLRGNNINVQYQSESSTRGYYDEEYVKIDGRWYISKMRLRYNMADAQYFKRFAGETAKASALIFG